MDHNWINELSLFWPFGEDGVFHGYILSDQAQLDVENMARQYYRSNGKFDITDFVKKILAFKKQAYILDKTYLGNIDFKKLHDEQNNIEIKSMNGLYFYEVYNMNEPPLDINGVLITELAPNLLYPMFYEFAKTSKEKEKNGSSFQAHLTKMGYFAKHPKVRLVNYDN